MKQEVIVDVFDETTKLTGEDFSLGASVDWITLTTRDDVIGMAWQEIYHIDRVLARENKQITEEKRWAIMSYEGVGFPGSIRVGYSKQLGWIVIASSGAAVLWKQLVGPDRRVTRIDLAVTQSLGFNIPDVPRRYYEILTSDDKSARNYALIQNTKKGQTLYVGSRRSEKFGRLYDKGVEEKSAPAGLKYRWEVEYKKPTSGEVAKALDAVREAEAEHITGMVFDFFQNRGVAPLFGRDGGMVTLQTQARITSLDRKLNWIRSQVRPSVRQLIMAGRSRDLFQAMGVPIDDEYLALLDERIDKQSIVTQVKVDSPQ